MPLYFESPASALPAIREGLQTTTDYPIRLSGNPPTPDAQIAIAVANLSLDDSIIATAHSNGAALSDRIAANNTQPAPAALETFGNGAWVQAQRDSLSAGLSRLTVAYTIAKKRSMLPESAEAAATVEQFAIDSLALAAWLHPSKFRDISTLVLNVDPQQVVEWRVTYPDMPFSAFTAIVNARKTGIGNIPRRLAIQHANPTISPKDILSIRIERRG